MWGLLTFLASVLFFIAAISAVWQLATGDFAEAGWSALTALGMLVFANIASAFAERRKTMRWLREAYVMGRDGVPLTYLPDDDLTRAAWAQGRQDREERIR